MIVCEGGAIVDPLGWSGWRVGAEVTAWAVGGGAEGGIVIVISGAGKWEK